MANDKGCNAELHVGRRATRPSVWVGCGAVCSSTHLTPVSPDQTTLGSSTGVCKTGIRASDNRGPSPIGKTSTRQAARSLNQVPRPLCYQTAARLYLPQPTPSHVCTSTLETCLVQAPHVRTLHAHCTAKPPLEPMKPNVPQTCVHSLRPVRRPASARPMAGSPRDSAYSQHTVSIQSACREGRNPRQVCECRVVNTFHEWGASPWMGMVVT